MHQLVITIFILGLCLGSFINAWVWRFAQRHAPKKQATNNHELSIMKGRSMCPSCRHTLHWYDLIPVLSWVTLRGRCRYCNKSISWQYPAVELLTAVLFVVSFLFWPFPIDTFLAGVIFAHWLALLNILVALAVYDMKYMLLPNKMIMIGWIITTSAAILSVYQGSEVLEISGMLIGSLTFGGLFYVLFQLSGGRWIGGGDVKLGFLLGVWLGGALQVSVAVFLASLLGLLFAGVMSLFKRLSIHSKIPFGPMLLLASFLVVLYFETFRHFLLWESIYG